ncbi:MAG: UrcA family protein [Woeseiaceae bacterium]
MRTSVRILTGVIAAAGIGGLATPVLAMTTANSGKDQVMRDETVSYRDLNISNYAGAKELYERIALAADNVCSFGDEATQVFYRDFQTCKDGAIQDAVARVDDARLTAIMDERIPIRELTLAREKYTREEKAQG